MSESIQDRARQAYAHQNVDNESALGLVVRIYQFALVECRRSRAAMIEKDWKVKGESLSRLLRSISLLQNSLDPETGGEVASNLDALYVYLMQRIGEANVQRDPTKLEEVEKHLSDLFDAWNEAAQKESAQPAVASQEPVGAAVG